ncbi:hypothetical protein OU798_14420 [Prolixibacteraceae bacterium Z1-6]|uniref:Outer membrane protein n=1 Tax=Draconibacterium aestuarii TaxID=2998507 RepID=A0A9X3F870_9BACT|nr:hypothetical protein [Prolixibacteraceae bacterium Z1-6]
MKISILTLIVTLFVVQSFAQSKGTLNTAPVQVTFITPIGTNGTNSINTVNNVSFNILAGYHSGVEGAEFGGIANLNRDFVNGFQFAGVTNYTGSSATGAQFAGVTNINLGTTNAFQFAGVTNVTYGDASVFQFAGVTNVNLGSTQIFQGAGVINFTMGSSYVIQAAGVANYAHEITGAQLGGVTNFALKDLKGAQIAGVVNAGKTVNGAQIAGVVNATTSIEGAQIAGVLNVAKKVNGVQIGFLNIADSISSGVPIGFLSIVRNGFHEFEIGFSEGLNTYAALKLGVNEFYNIFSIGTQFLSDDFRWAVGYGLGTHLVNQNNFRVNLEAISYQINEGKKWTDAYNGLQQVKLTFAGGKNEHLQFYTGPTFNLLVSKYENENGKIGSDFPPYTIVDKMSGNTNLKFWIGLNAGIRIH